MILSPENAALCLAVAFTFDKLVGELPTAVHPVIAIGRVSRWLERWLPTEPMALALLAGVALVMAMVLLFAGLSHLMMSWSVDSVFEVGLGAYFVKSTFAARMLTDEGREVAWRLEDRDLIGARERAARLCSRETSSLSPPGVASATIESVSENANDSIVAPLFYFCVAGVPGAVAYRVVNTLDARIGYRGRYEYLGRFAARLDDVLNIIPARLAAVFFLLAGFLTVGPRYAHDGLRVLARDRQRTESPNSGLPMAAASGVLGVRLEKPGVHVIGSDLRPAGPRDVLRACALTDGVAWITLIAVLMSSWVRHVVG